MESGTAKGGNRAGAIKFPAAGADGRDVGAPRSIPVAVARSPIGTALVHVGRAVVCPAGVHARPAVVVVVIAAIIALAVGGPPDADLDAGTFEIDPLRRSRSAA